MCGSSFFVRRSGSNPGVRAFASAVLVLHGYQATPIPPGSGSRRGARRLPAKSQISRFHRVVSSSQGSSRLQPHVAAFDHHHPPHKGHSVFFDSYAPIHIPPSEANCSSKLGTEAAQNCSGDAIEHGGVSAINNIVDSRGTDFDLIFAVSLIEFCQVFWRFLEVAIALEYRKHLTFGVADLYVP